VFDWQNIVYGLISIFFKLVGQIPQQWVYRLSHFMGLLLFHVDKKHQKITLSNLTNAFKNEKDSDEIRHIAQQVFKNLALILFEIGWSLTLTKKEASKYFAVKGLPHLKAAHKKGRGVLVFTAHAGNWELLPVASSRVGYEISILFRPLDFPPLNRFFLEIRSRFGAKMIPTARSMRKILQDLKQGGLIGILMDQNVDWYEGVFVDFFGRRACTNKGLALLALKTKAPVIPIFLIREKTGFTVEIGEEIPLVKTGDKIKDIETNTQQYNNAIEAFVRRYPDQWFWVHQRWKTRPYWPWPRRG
jgi:KDO2-lipid IV(A) lauroyltransferase